MHTPRQQAYWEKIKERPEVALAIDLLDLVPCETEEYKRNVKIEQRVDLIMDQIEMAPKEKRRVIKAKGPFDEPDLSWVKENECPF